MLGGWIIYPTPAAPQVCTGHEKINNCSHIGQNDLISLNHAIPWIFSEFHVCHISKLRYIKPESQIIC